MTGAKDPTRPGGPPPPPVPVPPMKPVPIQPRPKYAATALLPLALTHSASGAFVGIGVLGCLVFLLLAASTKNRRAAGVITVLVGLAVVLVGLVAWTKGR